MSEKTKEVKRFQDNNVCIYNQRLHGKTTCVSMNISFFENTDPEYEHRLRRQVGAPLWFSPTLSLKTLRNVLPQISSQHQPIFHKRLKN